jgi:hypothetical protein
MTLYLVQGTYTPEAVAAQVRNPADRIEVLRPGLEKTGARIVAYGYPSTHAGLALMVEVPEGKEREALNMSVYAGGAFTSIHAERLMSGAEWVDLLRASQGPSADYIPPGQT